MTRTPQGPREGVAKRDHEASAPRRPASRPRQGEERFRRGSRRTSAEPLAASWDPLAARAARDEDAPEAADVEESAANAATASRRARGERRTGLAGLLSTYGWRVYALPVLVVVTALALMNTVNSGQEGGAQAAGVQNQAKADSETPTSRVPPVPNPDPKLYDAAKASAELPGGGPFTERGQKSWSVVPGKGDPYGGPRMFKYTVEVENGIDLPEAGTDFAHHVEQILHDTRSWIGDKQHGFQRIEDSGRADLRISLTSQMTTREICGWDIPFEGSCYDPPSKRVTINIARWTRGAVVYQGSLVDYKTYVINHEVGHGLGYGHKPCQTDGQLAPIMMQQSWGVSNDYLATLGTDNVKADGKTCRPNPWPYPTVN
ncbi:DUF3152 domain-containing protein [Streptoalloteichus tenebrarius]|uniref:DUF3152 domain-containing protein n=1 Tax=Streptoalloteichus tenebrarius (strain ATCC 17920 / DSM 40477 / JCM 4838 / CBS 697.72 / NBRC 16177 / NCIMB 11028 / NRRL B-12390 / A12253. 1 / ISP 5477) TaxID=1933 RepID=UPI0020A4D8C3|nr:DUF3152 domain-containing protein [Streptoalloteichus tenebrarius]